MPFGLLRSQVPPRWYETASFAKRWATAAVAAAITPKEWMLGL